MERNIKSSHGACRISNVVSSFITRWLLHSAGSDGSCLGKTDSKSPHAARKAAPRRFLRTLLPCSLQAAASSRAESCEHLQHVSSACHCAVLEARNAHGGFPRSDRLRITPIVVDTYPSVSAGSACRVQGCAGSFAHRARLIGGYCGTLLGSSPGHAPTPIALPLADIEAGAGPTPCLLTSAHTSPLPPTPAR